MLRPFAYMYPVPCCCVLMGIVELSLKPVKLLRWHKPIYLRVGYVFESRFSAGMIEPISMSFGILIKEWSNFKGMVFFFL